MTPLGMTVKVNLLTARLIRKVLLKKERERRKEKKEGKKQNKTNIPTNEEVMSNVNLKFLPSIRFS